MASKVNENTEEENNINEADKEVALEQQNNEENDNSFMLKHDEEQLPKKNSNSKEDVIENKDNDGLSPRETEATNEATAATTEQFTLKADYEENVHTKHEESNSGPKNEHEQDEMISKDKKLSTSHEESNIICVKNKLDKQPQVTSEVISEVTEDKLNLNHEESNTIFLKNKHEEQPEVTSEVTATEDNTEKFQNSLQHKETTPKVDNNLENNKGGVDAASVTKGITIASIKSQLEKSEKTAAVGRQNMNAADERCVACRTRVYVMDKLVVDTQIYHKSCFKCVKCNKVLSLGNFTINNGLAYCKPHFMELFKLRGRYDDQGHIDTRMSITTNNVQKR